MSHQRPPISIVVLTLNEEVNIAQCLASVAWCDDVHVLDSGSTDRTQELARAAGAQVWVNRFKSFGQQRNWAIDHIPCKHAWHFHLDADERLTDDLCDEMLKVLGPDGTLSTDAAYLVPSKMILMDKWLKYSGSYPAYQVRLLHRDRCRFVDFGHGQREETTGAVGHLASPYLHYNFSKGLLDWMHKHNGYSDRESTEAARVRREGTRPTIGQLIQAEPLLRRRLTKSLSYWFPFRALWRLLYMMIVKRSVLDGMAGLHYSALVSMYEHWIELKIREREKPWHQQTLDLARRMMTDATHDGTNRPADSKGIGT